MVGTGVVFQIIITCDLSSRVRETGELFSEDHTLYVHNIKASYEIALLLLLSVARVTCKLVCASRTFRLWVVRLCV